MSDHRIPRFLTSRCPISLGLQKHINHFTILVHRSPQVVLLAVDFDEDLINEEGITVALVLSLQSPRVDGTEFDAPEPDGLVADCDTAFSEKVFNISMAIRRQLPWPVSDN
jgi:hypothetical protein